MKTKLKATLAAIALLAAGMLISCSKSDGESGAASASGAPESSNSLTVWTWDPNLPIYAMRRAGEIYAESHPDVSVDVVEISGSGDIEIRLTTMATSGDLSAMPDIFMMQDNSLKKYLSYYPELFTDLTDSGIDFSEFVPSKIAYSTIDGRNYGVPFDSGAAISCLRTDLLAQAGFTPDDFNDITWDEYIEKGRVVREATGLPMLTAIAGAPDHILIMLYSAGAALFREDGSVYMEGNDVLRLCMEYYLAMVREGIIVEVVNWDQYIAAINNGTTVGVLEGCWIIGSITAQPSQSGNWAVVNVPSLPGVPGATHYSTNGGSTWIISPTCSNIDLAVDFLKSTFGGSTQLYDDMIKRGGLTTWIPAATSPAYNEPVEFFGGQQIYADIVEFSSHTPTFPTSPFHYDARDAIGVALSNIIQQGADMDAELKAAQEVVEFNMEE